MDKASILEAEVWVSNDEVVTSYPAKDSSPQPDSEPTPPSDNTGPVISTVIPRPSPSGNTPSMSTGALSSASLTSAAAAIVPSPPSPQLSSSPFIPSMTKDYGGHFVITRPDSTTVIMNDAETPDSHGVSCISNSSISVNMSQAGGTPNSVSAPSGGQISWSGTLPVGLETGAARPLVGKLVTVGLGQSTAGENIYTAVDCGTSMSSTASFAAVMLSPNISETVNMGTQTGGSLRDLHGKDLHSPPSPPPEQPKHTSAAPSFLRDLKLFLTGGANRTEDLCALPSPSRGGSRYHTSVRRSSSVGDNLGQYVERLPEPVEYAPSPGKLSRTLSEPTVFCFPIDIYSKNAKLQISRSPSGGDKSWHSGLTSRSVSVDERICRICWQGEEAGPCIQPCYCCADVHEPCLQKWLQIANARSCEVCRYQFKFKRRLKPFSQWRWWLGKNRHLAQLEATILLLGIVTPPLLCGIILCSQKIGEYLSKPDSAWKTAGLMTLVLISMATYLAAILYFFRKFGIVCRLWCASNRMTVIFIDNLRGHPKVTEDEDEMGKEPNCDRANDRQDARVTGPNTAVWSIT